MPSSRHPIIPLHTAFGFGDRNADHGCACARVLSAETYGICERHARPGIFERCTFGIRDGLVSFEGGFFSSNGQADAFIGREAFPGRSEERRVGKECSLRWCLGAEKR